MTGSRCQLKQTNKIRIIWTSSFKSFKKLKENHKTSEEIASSAWTSLQLLSVSTSSRHNDAVFSLGSFFFYQHSTTRQAWAGDESKPVMKAKA